MVVEVPYENKVWSMIQFFNSTAPTLKVHSTNKRRCLCHTFYYRLTFYFMFDVSQLFYHIVWLRFKTDHFWKKSTIWKYLCGRQSLKRSSYWTEKKKENRWEKSCHLNVKKKTGQLTCKTLTNLTDLWSFLFWILSHKLVQKKMLNGLCIHCIQCRHNKQSNPLGFAGRMLDYGWIRHLCQYKNYIVMPFCAGYSFDQIYVNGESPFDKWRSEGHVPEGDWRVD